MVVQINKLFQFWFFLISNTLSILCSIFVLYHLLINRNFRQALQNHVVIILLICNLIIELLDIPFILYFFCVGITWQTTTNFDQFRTFTEYTMYAMEIILFAWMTIERHIFIFHDRCLLTKKKRFFLHYLPIIIIIIYCFIFYFTIIVFLSCGKMDRQDSISGIRIPCALNNIFIATWDLFCHEITPTIIILIFSIALIIRVLYKKSQLHQGIQWRKQRKMIIQILFITMLYQIFNFPWAFILFSQSINLPVDPDQIVLSVVYFFPYCLIFFYPFVCCATLPKFREKLKNIFFWKRQQRTVHPAIISKNPIQINESFQKTHNIY